MESGVMVLADILAPACEGVTLHNGDDKCLLEEQVRAYIKWVIGKQDEQAHKTVERNGQLMLGRSINERVSHRNDLRDEQLKRLGEL